MIAVGFKASFVGEAEGAGGMGSYRDVASLARAAVVGSNVTGDGFTMMAALRKAMGIAMTVMTVADTVQEGSRVRRRW